MMEESIVDRSWIARTPSPTRRDLVAVLFRRRRTFLVCFIAIFLAALVYAVLLPSYESQMKILVRRGRVDPPMMPQPTGSSEYSRFDVTEEELNSEVELLRDDDILRKVVLVHHLDQREKKWWNKDEETSIARATRRLASRLTVEPLRKTRMIVVRYRSSDPAQAGRVLRSLADFYQAKHLEVHRPSGEFGFFEQQAEKYGKDLETAESELLAMMEDSGTIMAAQERDAALQKLSDAEARYQEIPVTVHATEVRIQALQAMLASQPERRTSEIRSSDNQQLMEKMKSALLNLNLKRTELLTKFQPSYRLVQEVDQQIAETKAAIAAEIDNPLREETTAPDAEHDWAQSEMNKAQVELKGLQARAVGEHQLLSAYQERVRSLGRNSIEQQRLLRSAKMAEETYILYQKKREEARIGDALDERGIVNVAMIQPARTPALPQRSPWSVSLAGFLVAMVVSAGASFAADYVHPGFRSPSEVAAFLDTPVLASLPSANRRFLEGDVQS